MDDLSISVIIAVKNGASFLAEAIASVQAQTWSNIEIIVVDGGSTDGSQQIAASMSKVRVLAQQGVGFAGAWNEGIANSEGQYIAFLDSDDLWDPHKLRLQINALEEDRQYAYILASTRFIRQPGTTIPSALNHVDLTAFHAAPFPSALLARRSLFDRIGLFDETWQLSADIEWFRRIRDHGIPGLTMPEVLVYRRIHGSNLSYYPADRACFKRELLSILKVSLNCRRSGNP